MPSEALPNDRDIWRIAAPMILSNISVPLLGMVDTGVTGHLEDAVYLGAVAIGSTIFGFLYAGFNFLRMGTTGITAQAHGAGNEGELKLILGQALIVSMAIALALLLLQIPIATMAMPLLGPEPRVALFANEYFSIRIWSAPATLANYVLIGWFLGLQNARIPLYIVLIINLTNIILDLIFVLILDMKVAGVAAASVIAEFTGLIFAIFCAHQAVKHRGGRIVLSRLSKLPEYTAYLKVNAHLLVRTMALVFTFAFVTAAGARLGGLVLAANAVLMNMLALISFALDGFAHAAEALVGKAVGAKNKKALQQTVRLTLKWSLYVSVLLSLFFVGGGKILIRLLTDLPDVIEIASQYIPWFYVLPLIGVWSYLYDGVFVGATRAREMRNIMLFSTFAVFLPAWYAFQELGNHGLWLAFTIFLASRGIGMHYFYKTRVLASLST